MSVEVVGARQLALMLRARRSAELTTSAALYLVHDRASNRERMAARRLVERGLLSAPYCVGNAHVGRGYVYALTERGRSCWLRAKS
jgi:hypothetical protein